MQTASKRQLSVIIGAVAAALVGLFVIVGSMPPAEAGPTPYAVSGEIPETVAGWDAEQLSNAAIIMQAGTDLGFSERDITIAVMTAMGESSLRVLDYGDTVGPDSRGLFQQRDNWGPYEIRMDPYQSAVLFFNALGKVGMRDGMSPTLVAHTVQVNADPLHYERYWDDAMSVVASLTSADLDVAPSL